MDDGSKSGKAFKLSTHGFDYEQNLKCQAFLKEKFDLDTAVHKDRHLYHIYIKVGSATKFANLVRPHMVQSMLYKLGDYSDFVSTG